MTDAPAVGGAALSRAQGWKDSIGRLGLVGQGVVATIVGLLAIRIAMGKKDQAATSEGAVAWLAGQPLGKFLLVALTVALFALALWRFLCAAMGDPVEGSEPKDRLKYAVLGVIYLLFAIAILGVAVIGYAGYSFYKQVVTRKFAERLDADDGSWVVRLGMVGYAAQALVY